MPAITEIQFPYEEILARLVQIGRAMGGKVVLLGNVSPVLIARGTPQQVKEATRKVIEKLAPYGGLIVQDGNNIAPGSPVENINAMMQAATEFRLLIDDF
jgi:uroporphyrinogen-III decarboxylase